MQCKARVQFGDYTYAARNRDRQCGNSATYGDYCHAHKRYNVPPADTALMDAVRAQLES